MFLALGIFTSEGEKINNKLVEHGSRRVHITLQHHRN